MSNLHRLVIKELIHVMLERSLAIAGSLSHSISMNCNRTKGSNSLAQVGHINHLSLVSYKEFISQVMNWNNATMKTLIQGRDIPIRFNNKCKEKFTPTTKENPTYTIIDSNTAMSLYTTVGRRLLPKTTSSR